MKYFLVGIKGTGMSSLACCLKQMGYEVIGSDTPEHYFTEENLKKNNIEVKVFDEKNIVSDEYIYISSLCYDKNHVEVKAIINKGYKLYYYNEFIDYFFEGIKIGICGTHGKTTTTCFVRDMFNDNICALAGNGCGVGDINYQYFIFEACEYKEHFLKYNYDYLIINNIELDHTDYYKNIEEVYEAFQKVARKSKCVIIRDDLKIEHNNKYTFGERFDSFAKYNILNEDKNGYVLNIKIGNMQEIVKYPFYGKHMIENLMAALCVCYLNGQLNSVQQVVDKLKMPDRRMEEIITKNNIIIVDYAHHPTEIKALLESAKQKYCNKKIIIFFQPHTYSRTISLKEEFKVCFDIADMVYIQTTFTSKREEYDKEKEEIVESIFSRFERFSIEKLVSYKDKKNCVLLFAGAGDISKYIEYLIV